jgi:hypothetical protein
MKSLKFSNKLEYGAVLVLSVLIGALLGALHASVLEDSGHPESIQWTAFVVVTLTSVAVSMLGKYLLVKRKLKKNVVTLGQSGIEWYMSKEVYAFPFPNGVESTCLIEKEYVPSVVNDTIKVWDISCDWVEVQPKKLSELSLESGQRYYMATKLDEEAKHVVRETSRGWWPYKIA